MLSYDEALATLRRALVFGINPSLDGITALCEALGRPQDAFSVVQVTGTNGKGSTSRLIASILTAHGRSVGLYTSPELERMNERIEVGGQPVSDTDFAAALSAAVDAAETLRPGTQGTDTGFTEFELLTAAALWLFAQHSVDTAVLEVGMGGRWDATSVATPDVAVITGVGLDHTGILGDTREAIAAEKAAIIVPGSVAILGPGTDGVEQVFMTRIAEVGADAQAIREQGRPSPLPEPSTVRLHMTATPEGPLDIRVRTAAAHYGPLTVSAPRYQAENIATAIAAAQSALSDPLDATRVADAVASTTFPGRFEMLRTSPPVIIDGSHNPQAAGVLADAITDAFPDPTARPPIVLGVLADKDAVGIVTPLAALGIPVHVSQPDSTRALPAHQLARVVEAAGGEVASQNASLTVAIDTALAAGGGVLVTGSLTTAGQARAYLRDK